MRASTLLFLYLVPGPYSVLELQIIRLVVRTRCNLHSFNAQLNTCLISLFLNDALVEETHARGL